MLDGKKLVLIVDDDPGPLEMFSRFFVASGYHVRTAFDVIDAIHKLTDDVDLVVTDFDMPVLNGADFRNIIRQKYPEMPVIGVSGLRSSNWESLANVFDEFLFKPFTLSDLRKTVQDVFSRASSLWDGGVFPKAK